MGLVSAAAVRRVYCHTNRNLFNSLKRFVSTQIIMANTLEILCDVQKLHKEALRNGVLNSTQPSSVLGGQSIKEVIVNKCYTPLSASVSEEVCLEENETWETLEAVISREFAAGLEGCRVVLCGGAGMGKTTAVEKLIWDWATNTHLQHYTLVLPVCVQTLCTSGESLQDVLLRTHTHLTAKTLELVLQSPNTLLLVLDGLERFQNLLSDSPPSSELLSDPKQPASGAVLLHSLIEGVLLPGASLLLTSREHVQLNSVQSFELLGFSQEQRKLFFQQCFNSKAKAEQVLHHCEQAVGVAKLSRCPAFCWMLFSVCKDNVPQTLTELCCKVTHTLLQEKKVDVETSRQLLVGLGKLADHCFSLTHTHSSTADVIACGLQPFLDSPLLLAFLRVSRDDITSPDATYCFLSPVFQEFLLAASFYIDQSAPQSEQDESRILEEGPDLYHMFLAGLSDPAQRKLLEVSVGEFSSGRLSQFHQWLMSTVAKVLPGYQKQNQWRVLRLLHHAHSPALVRESVRSCSWRFVGYNDIQEEDCVALTYIILSLGEIDYMNFYRSALTDKQTQKLKPAFQLARSINLNQSHVSIGMITHLAQAMMDGQSTKLDLSSTNLGDEAMKILCLALPHSSLHTLNLDVCALTPACCKDLGKMLSASKLCVLNLRANEIEDEGLTQLISALGSSTCRLQDLCLDMCSLSGECIAVLSSALTCALSELRKLNICRNDLSENTLELLSQALQTRRSSLSVLNLFDTQVTSSCCPSIAAILQSEHCCLTELDLSCNELYQSGALLICDALRSPSCPLEKLCMIRCELTEQVFSALGSVLVSGTSKLKKLAIGINPAGETGAKHIWTALKHTHCRLQYLDLEMLSLTNACVEELCEAVDSSNTLTTLILKNNKISDVSVPRLVKLAQDRPMMTELNVQNNDMSEDVFELMDTCPNIRY